jgi:lipopolysaccharide/colanic/teichoic acid biosynthesis glycosyltransferase
MQEPAKTGVLLLVLNYGRSGQDNKINCNIGLDSPPGNLQCRRGVAPWEIRLHADSHFISAWEGQPTGQHARPCAGTTAAGVAGLERAENLALVTRSPHFLCGRRLSCWSQSAGKRLFDCVCVLMALPLLIPVLLLIALVVRVTSSGSVLFLQQRVGCGGRLFTIAKFRTLIHSAEIMHHAVTTADNQRFTPVGPFLRRWKLDELPQLLNVLAGDMSLVGPRPKLPQHVVSVLPCRPGITGAATIAFACEEAVLDRVPSERLESCYHTVVLPAKRRIDEEYMASATFLSDLKLLADTVMRRWDRSVMEDLLNAETFDAGVRRQLTTATEASIATDVYTRVLPRHGVAQPVPAEQATAF